jgi:hypothetical protein
MALMRLLRLRSLSLANAAVSAKTVADFNAEE